MQWGQAHSSSWPPSIFTLASRLSWGSFTISFESVTESIIHFVMIFLHIPHMIVSAELMKVQSGQLQSPSPLFIPFIFARPSSFVSGACFLFLRISWVDAKNEVIFWGCWIFFPVRLCLRQKPWAPLGMLSQPANWQVWTAPSLTKTKISVQTVRHVGLRV